MISMRPSQKLGMAVPSDDIDVIIRSSRLLRLSADKMPSGMAMVRPMAAEAAASIQV